MIYIYITEIRNMYSSSLLLSLVLLVAASDCFSCEGPLHLPWRNRLLIGYPRGQQEVLRSSTFLPAPDFLGDSCLPPCAPVRAHLYWLLVQILFQTIEGNGANNRKVLLLLSGDPFYNGEVASGWTVL